MRKLMFVALCLALLGGVACADSGTPEVRAFDAPLLDGCDGDDTTLETLELIVSAPTAPLLRGTTAKFEVKVVRQAKLNERLTADLPAPAPAANLAAAGDPTALPVEGANVSLGISIPKSLPLFGNAVTDADGMADVAVKVPRGVPTGTFDGTIIAWREVANGPCAHIVETGSYHQEDMATVK